MTRDVAQKLGYYKAASIYSSFFPALKGLNEKMSSSVPSTCVLLTDKAADIKTKINKHAKPGGQQTEEEHRRLGANLDIDIPYYWLMFFMEDDDKLEDIKNKYSKGELLTGEVKAILIKEI